LSVKPPDRPLRVIFAGTPEFARVALERLHNAGHTIALVLTQPDRPAGRGLKLHASAVKKQALEYGTTVEQPRSLRLDGKYPDDAAQAQRQIALANADVMVVAAYGLILPQWVLDAMQGGLGCLNIHGSLLPRWRGAAPIHRAIEAGDPFTGVTIMQMDAGLDTGDMLLAKSIPISAQDSTATLHDKVADLGADMVVEVLRLAASGELVAKKQPDAGVTYAHKIEKSEAPLDWQRDAEALWRCVRAFDPFPGATATLSNAAAVASEPLETIKIWRSEVIALPKALAQGTAPGTVLSVGPQGIDVATGGARDDANFVSALRLLELQRAGGKRMAAGDFLQGFPMSPGMCFVSPTRSLQKPV
jgi:methionyl-tRNA formyltransferase